MFVLVFLALFKIAWGQLTDINIYSKEIEEELVGTILFRFPLTAVHKRYPYTDVKKENMVILF